ncbi:uncharacterized protein LOC143464617 [Clavelina lepadiformis]|uniref:uncharacterized protein LOC143464617 n=1 Tax=Clavelina lepadiformis TaxID=159417 RepID=UPI00404253EB
MTWINECNGKQVKYFKNMWCLGKFFMLLLLMKRDLVMGASSYHVCNDTCVEQVMPLLEKSDRSTATSQFLRCMGNCTLKPVLQEAKNEIDFKCKRESLNHPLEFPHHADIDVHWIRVKNRNLGKFVIYPILELKPKDASIVELKGFIIDVFETTPSTDDGCYNLSIISPLSPAENQKLSFLVPRYYSYQSHMNFEIRHRVDQQDIVFDSTPKEYLEQAPSCQEAFGGWSCECRGEDQQRKVLYTAPDVVVNGYTVVVRWKPMDPCFSVTDYTVQIIVSPKHPKTGTSYLWEEGTHYSIKNSSTLEYTFSHIYEPKESFVLKTRLRIYANPKGINKHFADSEYTHFEIHDWKLLTSDLKVKALPFASTIEVSFPAANSSYDIKNYNICLNSSNYSHCEVVAQPPEETDKVVKEFKLNPGYYTAQVREIRKPLPKRTRSTKWTKQTAILEPKPTVTVETTVETKPSYLLLVAVTAGIVGVLFVVVVVFFFAWKRGHCRRLRMYLPATIAEKLDKQTKTFESRSLLLVWQRDLRSTELDETHSDNIRHLAAFLSVVCGLDVILDLFEDRQVCEGISKWIQSAYDKAEFVVFICPHFDYTRPGPTAQSVRSLIGDFDRIYNYLENEIGVGEKRSKFVTALLPYSDITCFEKAKYLKKMTSVYKLMNQIDDFFLHVQGRSKLSPDGKLDLQVVSKRGYIDTNEGRAIREGFIKFQQLLKDHSLCGSHTGSRVDDESSASDNISDSYSVHQRLLDGSRSDLTCPDCYRHQSTDEERGAPIMVNVVDRILPPNPPDCNFHIRQQVLNAPPSFVSNPEEEILLINAESGNLPTSESLLVSSNESININPGDRIEKLESHEVETSSKNLNFTHSPTSVQSSSGSEGIITSQPSSSNPMIILPGNLHPAPSSEDSGFLSNTV